MSEKRDGQLYQKNLRYIKEIMSHYMKFVEKAIQKIINLKPNIGK